MKYNYRREEEVCLIIDWEKIELNDSVEISDEYRNVELVTAARAVALKVHYK